MKVTVADVPDQRRKQVCLAEVLERLVDAVCQPGNRHADVCRPADRAWSHPLHRVKHVVAGVPQPRAVFGTGRPLEVLATQLGGDFLRALGLLRHPGFGAVELEEDMRFLDHAQLVSLVDCADAGAVDQLHPGDGDAHLLDHDRGLGCSIDIGEQAHGRGHGFRLAVELELDFSDHTQRAL